MDDIGRHPAFSEPARQPEAVTPGLIGNDNALKRPTRFCGLVPPTLQKPEQRVPLRLKFLQRLAVNPGHDPGHKPACLAHLDHHNQGAILLKGSEGSAQVVRLWHGGTSSVLSSDDRASPLAAPHSIYFPEIDRFRHNSRSAWFFAFLDRFPTPGSITALGKEAFIAAAWNVIGRKVAKERLLGDIYETARASIGLPIPVEAPAVRLFRLVIAEARSLIQQRNALEAMAVELLHESPDYKLLCRIPGVGPITALTILAEAGDLRRFGHHRQFLKFCGLDLATHQSGAFRGQTKLSKYGNARLRRALWLAGQVAIRQRENSSGGKFEPYTP